MGNCLPFLNPRSDEDDTQQLESRRGRNSRNQSATTSGGSGGGSGGSGGHELNAGRASGGRRIRSHVVRRSFLIFK